MVTCTAPVSATRGEATVTGDESGSPVTRSDLHVFVFPIVEQAGENERYDM